MEPGGDAAMSKEVEMPEPERDEYGRVCTSDAGPIPEEDRFEERGRSKPSPLSHPSAKVLPHGFERDLTLEFLSARSYWQRHRPSRTG